MQLPKTNEELVELYGDLKLVNTAEGYYLVHDRLEQKLLDWVILPKNEREEDVVAQLYFSNAFVPDISELRFPDAYQITKG